MLHVSIKPEVIFEIAGFAVTNSLFASWILLILFLMIGVFYSSNADSKDSKLVFFIRFVLTKLHSFFAPMGGKVGEKAFPFLASIFIFVLLANWMGLLPGFGSIVIPAPEEEHANEVAYEQDSFEVDEHTTEDEVQEAANDEESHDDTAMAATDDHEDDEHHASFIPVLRGATADLNMTLALAIVSFALIQVFGFQTLGLGYLGKFINFKSPLDFFIGFLEIVSEISKIISFAFRLFGNIFAGEVLLVVIAFLIPVLASFPFLLLEIFVGVIQALVFAMLTGVFINLATTEHH